VDFVSLKDAKERWNDKTVGDGYNSRSINNYSSKTKTFSTILKHTTMSVKLKPAGKLFIIACSSSCRYI
jgi:hypothetical protein